jgi:hypothetical protein
MIYKTQHRKQWSTRHYTENNDLQDTTQKTMIYKTLHKKQWSTRHYTENNDLQDTTQKTMIYKTLHRKQWSTRHYTENQRLSNKKSGMNSGALEEKTVYGRLLQNMGAILNVGI